MSFSVGSRSNLCLPRRRKLCPDWCGGLRENKTKKWYLIYSTRPKKYIIFETLGSIVKRYKITSIQYGKHVLCRAFRAHGKGQKTHDKAFVMHFSPKRTAAFCMAKDLCHPARTTKKMAHGKNKQQTK
jgi:hypothetical protein